MGTQIVEFSMQRNHLGAALLAAALCLNFSGCGGGDGEIGHIFRMYGEN